jgi:hypothetical protein
MLRPTYKHQSKDGRAIDKLGAIQLQSGLANKLSKHWVRPTYQYGC